MDETQAQLASLATAAKEHPGHLMTGYSTGDREHLTKLAGQAQREADRLNTEANSVSVEGSE